MGLFNSGKQLKELTSAINDKQLIDKAERAIGRKQFFNVGLSLMLESQYNFFMFTPFFFLKNIDPNASGKIISNLPFNVGFESWDADIKKMWIEVSRAKQIDEETILD